TRKSNRWQTELGGKSRGHQTNFSDEHVLPFFKLALAMLERELANLEALLTAFQPPLRRLEGGHIVPERQVPAGDHLDFGFQSFGHDVEMAPRRLAFRFDFGSDLRLEDGHLRLERG